MSPPRRGGRPRRRVSKSAIRRAFLFFVEGEETEERYLVDWARRHRDRVLIRVDGFHGRPLQLVREAIERKKADARDARRGRGRAYDEIWCVFDVDDHPNFSQAVDLARRHDIELAVSNPCIELWFILHFEDQSAYLDRTDAQRRAQELLGCGKDLTPAALDALYAASDEAIERARLLYEKHAKDGSPPLSNPSSGIARLIEAIRRH